MLNWSELTDVSGNCMEETPRNKGQKAFMIINWKSPCRVGDRVYSEV